MVDCGFFHGTLSLMIAKAPTQIQMYTSKDWFTTDDVMLTLRLTPAHSLTANLTSHSVLKASLELLRR